MYIQDQMHQIIKNILNKMKHNPIFLHIFVNSSEKIFFNSFLLKKLYWNMI